jgi:two-component system, cell cycle sensor histidine kinase and response regulator CckA
MPLSLRITHESVDMAAVKPSDHTHVQHQGNHQETILLGEDEDSLRLLTQRILTRHGFTVIAARDGPEAIELAGQDPGGIDLLLTDVIMPHMNGYELATHLQADPTLPVIYMFGYAEPLLASRTVLPAGVILLSKPITQQHILAAVRRSLDAGGRARHRAQR